METLRDSDGRAGFELLGRVIEAGPGLAGMTQAMVRALPRLVASELTTLSICDLASGRRRVIGVPDGAIGADERAAFDRHFRAHPLVRYHADLRGPGAHRISDSVPFAQFREGVLYADYYRRVGIDHAVALPLHVDSRWLVSLVLNRRGRDFSERDCALLDLVGTPLSRLYRQALERRRAQHELAALRALLDPGAATVLDEAQLTPREREALRWLAAGKTDRDIAAILGCSHRTVHKHLQRAYVKLGVETRTAAAMRLAGRC
jgi:DNA-binding CsgD family transcriptional regulator